MTWFKKRKEETEREETVVLVPESVPMPTPVVAPVAVPVPVIEVPKTVKQAKVSRRIAPEDVEPFQLGRLQQALQVYYHLIERRFTFADLVEYVNYATQFQRETVEQDHRDTLAAAARVNTKNESPQRIPLTREERKKFRKRR